MLDMGFLPDVRRILRKLPSGRQSMMFSATMPYDIRRLASEMLHEPVTIEIGRQAPVKRFPTPFLPCASPQDRAAPGAAGEHPHGKRPHLHENQARHAARGLALEKAGLSVSIIEGTCSRASAGLPSMDRIPERRGEKRPRRQEPVRDRRRARHPLSPASSSGRRRCLSRERRPRYSARSRRCFSF